MMKVIFTWFHSPLARIDTKICSIKIQTHPPRKHSLTPGKAV